MENTPTTNPQPITLPTTDAKTKIIILCITILQGIVYLSSTAQAYLTWSWLASLASSVAGLNFALLGSMLFILSAFEKPLIFLLLIAFSAFCIRGAEGKKRAFLKIILLLNIIAFIVFIIGFIQVIVTYWHI